jgi:hypothetical protein
MTDTSQPSAAKRPKHRSPSYPAIDLKTAIAQTRKLQNEIGNHAAMLPAAVKAWGFSAKSSNGLLTVAALKKYGLLEDSGKGAARQVQISRFGQELLFFGEDTSEWLGMVRQAALKPTIHAALWKKYGPVLPPSDSVMTHFLIFERLFSEPAANDALRQFRATVNFARLADAPGNLLDDEPLGDTEDEPDSEDDLTPPATIVDEGTNVGKVETPGRGEKSMRTVQVTYSPSEWALVQAAFPMQEEDWDAMIAMLQAMKRGLVVPSDA